MERTYLLENGKVTWSKLRYRGQVGQFIDKISESTAIKFPALEPISIYS